MNDKLSAIKEKIEVIQRGLGSIRKEFQIVISDKSIPLEERWTTFMKAPSDLKCRDSWIPTFGFEETYHRTTGESFCWYDDMYIERHQTVDISSVLDYLEDSLIQEGTDISKHNWVTPEIIEEFKEEILSRAMESFVFDW